jgi:hypothetical protein
METGFCKSCSSIDFLTDTLELNRTIQDFEQGSEMCSMCRFLLRSVSSVSPTPVAIEKLFLDGSRYYLQLSEDSRPVISLYFDPGTLCLLRISNSLNEVRL